MKRVNSLIILLLIFFSMALRAEDRKVVATNLALHSIVSYLLKDIDEPVFLGHSVEANEQVALIDAQVLFYDSRSEDISLYIQLYFSGKNQKRYDLKNMPGVELTRFMYWPEEVRALALMLAQILKEEFPNYAKEINDNHLYFQREISRYRGQATKKEFFEYTESQDILNAKAEERYFIILTKLGLLIRGG